MLGSAAAFTQPFFLPTNISNSWRDFLRTNTLAYLEH
jgi:hypothetical protein